MDGQNGGRKFGPIACRVLLFCLLAVLVPARTAVAATFHGAACTQDCAGHAAGYAWAARKKIGDPKRCGGTSPSFVAGCKIWAAEHPARQP